MDSTTKLRQITTLLRKAYGPRQRERHWDNPLDSLIQTILSQNTTADNCERAYASLRQRFKKFFLGHRPGLHQRGDKRPARRARGCQQFRDLNLGEKPGAGQ